jgi:poly-beta-hydroxyalkanoate depolymerase
MAGEDLTKVNARNIIKPTIEMLEERKKKCDEEDLQAVLAIFKVDRWGNITKVKDITFTSTSTDASTEVIPNVSDSSSGVTLKQVKSMLAERDVYLVNWLSSRKWKTTNKQPAITKDLSPVVSGITSETLFLNHRQHPLWADHSLECR